MHAATVALYKFGNHDHGFGDNYCPQAEYAGTLTVSGEIEYSILVKVRGKRIEKMDKLPLLLGVAIEEVK